MVGVALIAGCSSAPLLSTPDPHVPRPSPSTAQQLAIVELLAADDEQPTMSAEQRTALEAILRTGTVNFEEYAEAVQRTLDCAIKAGLSIDGPREVVSNGQATLQWGWRDPTQADGDPRVGEHCRLAHSFGIEQAYLNTDIALEFERQHFEAFRGPLLDCLERAGAAPDDPTMDIYDLIDYSNEVYLEPGWEGVDCLTDAEVTYP